MSSSKLQAVRDDLPTPGGYGDSWLLRVFPATSQTNIFLRAVFITAAILGIEYLVEVVWLELEYWNGQAYFTGPGVALGAVGLVLSLVIIGQWGARYVKLWEEVRQAFDVSADQYDVVIRRSLAGFYSRDYVPFLMFVVVQIVVYQLFGSKIPAGYFHVGFLHFFGMTALYSFYQHTVITRRVTRLNLVDLNRARPTLSEVGDFIILVSLIWFAALSVLILYFWRFTPLNRNVDVFYTLLILLLVGVGLLLFIIPVVTLHEALMRVKRQQLRTINDEYEAVFEAWREGDLEEDPSVALEALNTRREIIKSSSTWPYRLDSVIELAVGAVIPTVLSTLQTVSNLINGP